MLRCAVVDGAMAPAGIAAPAHDADVDTAAHNTAPQMRISMVLATPDELSKCNCRLARPLASFNVAICVPNDNMQPFRARRLWSQLNVARVRPLPLGTIAPGESRFFKVTRGCSSKLPAQHDSYKVEVTSAYAH